MVCDWTFAIDGGTGVATVVVVEEGEVRDYSDDEKMISTFGTWELA